MPPQYAASREALRSIASYVVAPALKEITGRIRLAVLPGGFGTPAFGAGRRVWVDTAGAAAELVVDEDGQRQRHLLTTIRELGAAVGVEVSADPGVGGDLTPFEPDSPLAIDLASARIAAGWLAFGEAVLSELRFGSVGHGIASDLVLWPEHFDLGFSLDGGDVVAVNYGASPGDAGCEEPYLYVGPWDLDAARAAAPDGEADRLWNAPFGAILRRSELLDSPAPSATARTWFDARIAALITRQA